MPNNSDVVLILGQYDEALKAFKSTFKGHYLGRIGWFTRIGFIEEEKLNE